MTDGDLAKLCGTLEAMKSRGVPASDPGYRALLQMLRVHTVRKNERDAKDRKAKAKEAIQTAKIAEVRAAFGDAEPRFTPMQVQQLVGQMNIYRVIKSKRMGTAEMFTSAGIRFNERGHVIKPANYSARLQSKLC